MANVKEIRKRIASVKNTQQITKAMKMVAAAKLRRAQEAIVSARPFAVHLDGILRDLVERGEMDEEAPPHPLLRQPQEINKVELVVMTSDRGLCGGFNSNLLRRGMRFVHEEGQAYETLIVSTIGRRGRDFFKRRTGFERGTHHEGLFEDLRFARAEAIAQGLAERFLSRDLHAAYLLYNRFKSAISQEITLIRLLPIGLPGPGDQAKPVDFVYEPSRAELLEKLVPQHLSTQVWRALLESVASEHGARMSAMDNATRNAGDMIDRLTLIANRTRQAAITKELMEIVSGAEALK